MESHIMVFSAASFNCWFLFLDLHGLDLRSPKEPVPSFVLATSGMYIDGTNSWIEAAYWRQTDFNFSIFCILEKKLMFMLLMSTL